jgi:hypothetical protein
MKSSKYDELHCRNGIRNAQLNFSQPHKSILKRENSEFQSQNESHLPRAGPPIFRGHQIQQCV